MRFPLYLAIVSAAFVGLASPCAAQNFKSFVSGLGSDTAGCGARTAPCRSFNNALTNTIAGGEIDCLDSGGYVHLTINRSVSIICDGVNGEIGANGRGIAISINVLAATDRVVLSGLNLDGFSLTPYRPAEYGVQVRGAGSVTIRNSSIRNFTGAGVDLAGIGASPATRVVIQNTYITNSGIGVTVGGRGGGTRVFIRDSFIENGAGGVSINGGGANNSAAISNTVIDNNTSYALNVGGSGNSAGLENSILSGSPAGLVIGSGGVVISIGPSNTIAGTGAPTTTTPYR